ncbi:MAG: DUF484 family protein [Gammaproteobacteria bacterium]|nr:DUF484 family protein [Gammaproteobacteria bacterium]
MSSEQADKLSLEIDEKQVIEYLRHHPDFFQLHRDLLSELELPHNTGAHASLIERQVDILRQQRSELKQKLDQLITSAQANEILSEDIHQGQLMLLDAETLEEIFELVDESLQEEFDADAIAIRLINIQDKSSDYDDLIILDDAILPDFEKMMMAGNPSCESLTHKQLYYLFGSEAQDIASNVIIPLRDDEVIYGILAIGSSDPERYQADMGTIFLRRYGEFLTHLLKPFLTAE